jgi:hypothetical protein
VDHNGRTLIHWAVLRRNPSKLGFLIES